MEELLLSRDVEGASFFHWAAEFRSAAILQNLLDSLPLPIVNQLLMMKDNRGKVKGLTQFIENIFTFTSDKKEIRSHLHDMLSFHAGGTALHYATHNTDESAVVVLLTCLSAQGILHYHIISSIR